MVKKKKSAEPEKPKVKVDLACGATKQEGYIGVDKHKIKGVDIAFDLQSKKPWPFKDNSVDEVFCSHYIEHCVDLLYFWQELYRILKVGGEARIIAPYGKSNRAWQDATHVRAIVEETFLYLDKNWRKQLQLDHYYPDIDFEYTVMYAGIDPAWANRNEEARQFAIKHYWNVVMDLQCLLKKRA